MLASPLAATMSTASALEMNSHTPSDATIKYLSSKVTVREQTAGVAHTPIGSASKSPNARATQSPGPRRLFPFCSYSRAGTYVPSSSVYDGCT